MLILSVALSFVAVLLSGCAMLRAVESEQNIQELWSTKAPRPPSHPDALKNLPAHARTHNPEGPSGHHFLGKQHPVTK